MKTVKTLIETFRANGNVMPLVGKSGTIDGHLLLDAFAREVRFDDDETAALIAGALVRANNSLSYTAHHPEAHSVKEFILYFLRAMNELNVATTRTKIKRIILPNAFEKISFSKPLEAHAASYGIAQEMTLPNGVTIAFRKKPYTLDLGEFGAINHTMGVMMPALPTIGSKEAEVRVGRFLHEDGGRQNLTTDRLRRIWMKQMAERPKRITHMPTFHATRLRDVRERALYGVLTTR